MLSSPITAGLSFAATAVGAAGVLISQSIYPPENPEDDKRAWAAGLLCGSLGGVLCSYIQHKKEVREKAVENRANAATKPEISVIGVGLSRSGTVSFWQALNELGFSPVWHGLDMFVDPIATGCWQKYDETNQRPQISLWCTSR